MESSLKHNKTKLTKWRNAMTLDFMSSKEASVEHNSTVMTRAMKSALLLKRSLGGQKRWKISLS